MSDPFDSELEAYLDKSRVCRVCGVSIDRSKDYCSEKHYREDNY